MRRSIAEAFHVAAPGEPNPVDLTRDVGPNLAYTHRRPARLQRPCRLGPSKEQRPRDRGGHHLPRDLAHHGRPDQRPALYRSRQSALSPPRDLWHALTLYTTWKLTKRELHPDPGRTYLPDVDADQRFERNVGKRFARPWTTIGSPISEANLNSRQHYVLCCATPQLTDGGRHRQAASAATNSYLLTSCLPVR